MRPNSSGPGTTGAADRVQLVTSGADGLPGPLIALDGGSLRPPEARAATRRFETGPADAGSPISRRISVFGFSASGARSGALAPY